MFLASLWLTYPYQPIYDCYQDKKCVYTKISADGILLNQWNLSRIHLVQRLVHKYALNSGSCLVLAASPGAYAMFDRKSPNQEIFAFLPHTSEYQRGEIERLKRAKPKFILDLLTPADGNDGYLYHNSHPLVYKYITDNFLMVGSSSSPLPYKLYR